MRGVLPQVLNRSSKIQAAHAYDGEIIKTNLIYVAPPGQHLLLEEGRVCVTRGPKKNRFCPAIDPLFRSAAYVYGKRVLKVVLSGALDDGTTSGLWTIKQHGSLAILQDPSMSKSLRCLKTRFRRWRLMIPFLISEMADLLAHLSQEQIPETSGVMMEETPENEKLKVEIGIAAEDNAFERNIMKFGELTPYTCSDCHGVLLCVQRR